jgi:chromosome segregation ATPase
MEWVNSTITLLSLIAAILAWIAKLRWSKEFAAAKDAAIAAKDAQIDQLQEQIRNITEAKNARIEQLEDQINFLQAMDPVKLQERFVSMRQQLEEMIDELQAELEKTKKRLAEKMAEIGELKERATKDDLAEVSKVALASIAASYKNQILTLESNNETLKKAISDFGVPKKYGYHIPPELY